MYLYITSNFAKDEQILPNGDQHPILVLFYIHLRHYTTLIQLYNCFDDSCERLFWRKKLTRVQKTKQADGNRSGFGRVEGFDLASSLCIGISSYVSIRSCVKDKSKVRHYYNYYKRKSPWLNYTTNGTKGQNTFFHGTHVMTIYTYIEPLCFLTLPSIMSNRLFSNVTFSYCDLNTSFLINYIVYDFIMPNTQGALVKLGLSFDLFLNYSWHIFLRKLLRV